MSQVNRAHESKGRFGKDRGLGQKLWLFWYNPPFINDEFNPANYN